MWCFVEKKKVGLAIWEKSQDKNDERVWFTLPLLHLKELAKLMGYSFLTLLIQRKWNQSKSHQWIHLSAQASVAQGERLGPACWRCCNITLASSTVEERRWGPRHSVVRARNHEKAEDCTRRETVTGFATLPALDCAGEMLTALRVVGKVRRVPHIGGGIVVYAKAVRSTLPSCEQMVKNVLLTAPNI